MASRLEKLLAFFEKDRTDPFIRYGIALEYTSLQQYEDACQWFEGVRKEFPDYLPTYYMLGGLYCRINNHQAAKIVYEEGLKIARRQQDMHTLGEIRAALNGLR